MLLRLGELELDGYDYAAAARAFEGALRLDPSNERVRSRLARCWNVLRRDRDTLELLSDDHAPHYERAVALSRLGRIDEAEAGLRDVLAAEPQHRHACRLLASLLRKAGRIEELVAACEELHARGARHAQLFYDWGLALGLAGRAAEARALLPDPAHIATLSVAAPAGFSHIEEFNAALADELLANPNRLGGFPEDEEANRGSERVEALFAGRRPDLVRALLDVLQQAAETFPAAPRGSFDPWPEARPASARLKAWGLIQRGGDYEEWHLHRGGWLSGVYYVRVPEAVSAEGHGPGCIEFGPPQALARAMPDLVPVRRYRPREGMLLLAPSHYPHRTIPSGVDDYRISFAFDVVPVE